MNERRTRGGTSHKPEYIQIIWWILRHVGEAPPTSYHWSIKLFKIRILIWWTCFPCALRLLLPPLPPVATLRTAYVNDSMRFVVVCIEFFAAKVASHVILFYFLFLFALPPGAAAGDSGAFDIRRIV